MPYDNLSFVCLKKKNRIEWYMMYGSWDMEYDRHKFLSFWTAFCPFTPLWTQKIKIFKKMEKIPEDIIILQT